MRNGMSPARSTTITLTVLIRPTTRTVSTARLREGSNRFKTKELASGFDRSHSFFAAFGSGVAAHRPCSRRSAAFGRCGYATASGARTVSRRGCALGSSQGLQPRQGNKRSKCSHRQEPEGRIVFRAPRCSLQSPGAVREGRRERKKTFGERQQAGQLVHATRLRVLQTRQIEGSVSRSQQSYPAQPETGRRLFLRSQCLRQDGAVRQGTCRCEDCAQVGPQRSCR